MSLEKDPELHKRIKPDYDLEYRVNRRTNCDYKSTENVKQ